MSPLFGQVMKRIAFAKTTTTLLDQPALGARSFARWLFFYTEHIKDINSRGPFKHMLRSPPPPPPPPSSSFSAISLFRKRANKVDTPTRTKKTYMLARAREGGRSRRARATKNERQKKPRGARNKSD